MAKTILIPWCVETGGIPHWVSVSGHNFKAGDHGTCGADGWRKITIEWRVAAPFEPPFPTCAIDWHRGRSAANMILGGPVLREEGEDPWKRQIRAEFYLTQMGLLGLLKAGAFDGPTIRKGVKLMPVKRGQNYLVEVAP